MSRFALGPIAAVVLLGLGGPAHAGISTIATPSTTAPAAGMMSTFSGVTTVTFDNSAGLPAGFSGGGIFTGNQPLEYAAPAGDTSNFFAVGTAPSYSGTASFRPGGMYNYFGLYWGSIDPFNSIAFSLNGVNVGTFLGSAFPPANGSQTAANANEYVDFLFSPGTSYDTVTFTTPSFNFEFDNVAYGNVAVPEPASLAVLGSGLLGLAVAFRRKKNNSRVAISA